MKRGSWDKIINEKETEVRGKCKSIFWTKLLIIQDKSIEPNL